MVTILCLAYNQKDYIRDCLEGFVRQQTTFPVRAIVHDDASTDGTADIIREYAERYPALIQPIFETENQLRKDGLKSLCASLQPFFSESRYIAFCEGDDYWTDPLKLERQVSFLETHPDHALCYHHVTDLNMQTGEQRLFVQESKQIPDDADIYDLVNISFFMRTCSTCYRASAIDYPRLLSMLPVFNLDILLQHMAATHGRIMRLPQTMAVYRMGVGAWTGSNLHDTRHFASMIRAYTLIQQLMPNDQLRAGIEHQIQWCISDQAAYEREYQRYTQALEKSLSRRIGLVLLYPFSAFKKLFTRHRR